MGRNFLHWRFMTMSGFIVNTPHSLWSLILVSRDESECDLWSVLSPSPPLAAHVTMIQLPRDQLLSLLHHITPPHNSSRSPRQYNRDTEFTTDQPTCPLSFWWKFLLHSLNIYVYEFDYDAKMLNFEWMSTSIILSLIKNRTSQLLTPKINSLHLIYIHCLPGYRDARHM